MLDNIIRGVGSGGGGRLTSESIMSNNTIDTEMRKDFHLSQLFLHLS